MQALFYTEYGGRDVFQLGTQPKPAVGPHDVLVRTKSAGLNPVDWKLRGGYIPSWPQQLPIITGWDVAGVVEEVGAEVTKFAVGDEVYSYNRPAFDNAEIAAAEGPIGLNGCMAEFVSVADWKLAKKPASSSFPEAGGVPLAALTAWQGIFEDGELKPGQSIVILNASGGVGSFAVQFAKDRGCTVVGTCSGKNKAFVEGLGATVVDYTAGDIVQGVRAVLPEGADVVFDCFGGEQAKQGLDMIKEGGIVVSIANFEMAALAAAAGKRGKAMLVRPSGEQLAEIGSLIDSGRVRVARVTEFGVDHWAQAYELLESHHATGKIVINF